MKDVKDTFRQTDNVIANALFSSFVALILLLFFFYCLCSGFSSLWVASDEKIDTYERKGRNCFFKNHCCSEKIVPLFKKRPSTLLTCSSLLPFLLTVSRVQPPTGWLGVKHLNEHTAECDALLTSNRPTFYDGLCLFTRYYQPCGICGNS